MTPFDIVRVPFPFTDLSTTKQRPCLLLTTITPKGLRGHLVVAMMTSQLSGLSFPHDVVLSEWQKAGLPKPTLVRLAKVVTLEESLVNRKLGRLLRTDQQVVKNNFRELYAHLLS